MFATAKKSRREKTKVRGSLGSWREKLDSMRKCNLREEGSKEGRQERRRNKRGSNEYRQFYKECVSNGTFQPAILGIGENCIEGLSVRVPLHSPIVPFYV